MMQELEHITDATFEARVLKADRPVLLEFTASWCGPCKAMKPALADLSREYAGEVDILAIDIDENRETTDRHAVRGVPTFYLFDKGEVVFRRSGGTTRSALAAEIETALGNS